MCDIRFFKSAYHCYDVAAKLMKYYEQDEMISRLKTKLPKTLVVHDAFEWNCYYTIFKKHL